MNSPSLRVHTARVSYSGPDRLDITRKSAGPEGLPFAPSWAILRPALAQRRGGTITAAAWERYGAAYTAEMRASYRTQREAWTALLARREVTLCCYCTDPAQCHRTVLASILSKLGALVLGERAPALPDNVVPMRRVTCKVCGANAPPMFLSRERLEQGLVCHRGGTRAQALEELLDLPGAHLAPCGRECVNGEVPVGAKPKGTRPHAGPGCSDCRHAQEGHAHG